MSDSNTTERSSNSLELTIESLDQWENELDQFAADIKRRLSLVSLVADVSEPSPRETDDLSEEDQVLDLLKSLSEQTRQ